MAKTKKGDYLKFLRDIFMVLVGTVIAASSISIFLVPAKLVSGGLTGVGTILYYTAGWPIGLVVAVMNVPLFILSYRIVGKRFVIKTAVASLFWSLVLDLIQFPQIDIEPLMAAFYGGAGMGLGIGIVLRCEASTGGTDMAAMMVHRKIPVLRVSWTLFALDGAVIAASAFVFGLVSALYSIIAILISSKVIDIVQEGFDSSRAFYIITSKPLEISTRIGLQLERGCTQISAKGVFSGEDRAMLLAVVKRLQVSTLKRIVHEEDEQAFFMIADVREVMGVGFDEKLYAKKKASKKRIAGS